MQRVSRANRHNGTYHFPAQTKSDALQFEGSSWSRTPGRGSTVTVYEALCPVKPSHHCTGSMHVYES